MSISQLNMAFNDSTIKGNEKLLMIVLADFASENGISFPSWNSLITKTCMSRGAISKWLNILVEKGLLLKKHRKRKNGSNSSNKYLIYPKYNVPNLDEEEYIEFGDLLGHSSEVELHHSSEVELQSEPSLSNHHSKASKNEAGVIFETIWIEYTLKFLTKKKKRGGGSKQIAKKNFNNLINKYTIQDIKALVVKEYKLDYNRDLQRVFSLQSMKQFVEDREVA